MKKIFLFFAIVGFLSLFQYGVKAQTVEVSNDGGHIVSDNTIATGAVQLDAGNTSWSSAPPTLLKSAILPFELPATPPGKQFSTATLKVYHSEAGGSYAIPNTDGDGDLLDAAEVADRLTKSRSLLVMAARRPSITIGLATLPSSSW